MLDVVRASDINKTFTDNADDDDDDDDEDDVDAADDDDNDIDDAGVGNDDEAIWRYDDFDDDHDLKNVTNTAAGVAPGDQINQLNRLHQHFELNST